jgi:hypothetical protein
MCGNYTYLTKINVKTIWVDGFTSKLTLNYPFIIDPKENKFFDS